ncbi:MAG: glycosyltransferase family 2 protein [Actinomycetes bacterium]
MTPRPAVNGRSVLVVVPALNEATSVAGVIAAILYSVPDADVLVVDDGSKDDTAIVARAAGAQVVRNPFNLGVGGAMRVGFRLALAKGYDTLVQVDADGQHDPADVATLVGALDDSDDPQVVIGARFAGAGNFEVPKARRLAMRILARRLSRITGTELTDVTSGFRAHNRAAIVLFADCYPADYLADTVESLVILADAGGRVQQVPVTMRAREAGAPSQSTLRAAEYLARVTLFLGLSAFRRRSSERTSEGASS